jgi:Arc/MetJ family transcription regulator
MGKSKVALSWPSWYMILRRNYIQTPPELRRRRVLTEGGTVFTSVDIDKELFTKAWGLSGLKTKKALFEEVLRVYVRLHEQGGVQSLRGKLAWKGDLDEIREERGAGPR